MRARRALSIAAIVLASSAAHAIDPGEIMSNPTLEARARAISSQLRCLVCQNESIDESEAPLAKDLRTLVRQRLAAGDDDAQVESFLVARYGDFILLRPPLKLETLLLWLAPVLCLLAGAFAAWRAVRSAKRRSREAVAPLSEAERLRLSALMDDSASEAESNAT